MKTTLSKKLEDLGDELNSAARSAIYLTALGMGRQVDPVTTMDLVQEVWLVALTHLQDYNSAEQLRVFFIKTAVRVTQAHLRWGLLARNDQVEPGEGGREAARVETSVMAHGVLNALNRLPATNREIVRLSFYENLSRRDISARTGLSEGAVKMRLHRSLKALSGGLPLNLVRRAGFKHQATLAGITAAIVEQAAAGEIHEPRAEFHRDRSGSTVRDELGTSDLDTVTEASLERIGSHLRALQTCLARIESKFETLAS